MRTFGTITECSCDVQPNLLMIQIRPIYTKSSGTFVPFVTAMCPFMSPMCPFVSPMFPFESQKCPRGGICSLSVSNVPFRVTNVPFCVANVPF